MVEREFRNYKANNKFRKIHGYPKGWNPYKYGSPTSTYHYPKLSEEEISELLGEE